MRRSTLATAFLVPRRKDEGTRGPGTRPARASNTPPGDGKRVAGVFEPAIRAAPPAGAAAGGGPGRVLRTGFGVLLLFLCAGAAGALAGDPAAPGEPGREDVLARFAPDQRQKLLAGEPVFESLVSDGDSSSPKGSGRASVLVKAPVEVCFRKFCEIDKHPLYFPRKTVSRVLEDHGTELVVYKELKFPLKTVKFYVRYTVDPAAHRIDFRIDKSRPGDIRESEGFFHFIEVDSGTTLFDYGLLKAEPGMAVPGFIRQYLTSHDLPKVVLNFKKWLESGGAWKK